MMTPGSMVMSLILIVDGAPREEVGVAGGQRDVVGDGSGKHVDVVGAVNCARRVGCRCRVSRLLGVAIG